jgi:hypothetical protein
VLKCLVLKQLAGHRDLVMIGVALRLTFSGFPLLHVMLQHLHYLFIRNIKKVQKKGGLMFSFLIFRIK